MLYYEVLGVDFDYKFECRVMKVGIKDKGFVDVFKKVYFIIEYKWFGSDFGVVF